VPGLHDKGSALAGRVVGDGERPQQHERAGERQGAADREKHEGVEAVAPGIAQPVEYPHADERRRA
jgi:hypothetical protein